MDDSRVRIYLDDKPDPILDEDLPVKFKLDTLDLEDGPHRVVVRARDGSGREGYEEIPFSVHNGPGVVVSGLKPNSTRRGKVSMTVDAFSSDDPFDPRRAEARSSIPVWVWVMSLFVLAWAVFYAASMWKVPPQFATTPTYASEAATPHASALTRKKTAEPMAQSAP